MRRSLTQAEARAPIVTDGEPRLAASLAAALRVGAGSRDHTHGFHTYPARMHPHIARRLLEAIPPGATLLDPFCGSGTVLVEGLLRGARTVGVDASPLAILVARAKTARPRRDVVQRARAIARDVLAEGKAARRSGWEPPPRRAVKAALRGWFDPHVRAELEAIAAAVGDDDLLRSILSSILIKVSRRASDTRGEKIERRVGRGMAARLFAQRAEELVKAQGTLWREAPPRTPVPELHLGDARRLPLADRSVNMVVTSPPYGGTYDYLDHHQLRLSFLDIDEASFAEREIGARRSFGGAGAREAYARDLSATLEEIARVLVPAGRAYLLIGDSLAGDRALHADALVREVSPLPVLASASAARPLWGAVERAAFRRAPKREHLICLGRPSTRG